MSAQYLEAKVLSNRRKGTGIFKMEVSGDFEGAPGQFYMVRGWNKEPFLSRPISIHGIEKGRIQFLYQVVGEGTKLLSNLKQGDTVGLLGPLGHGFDTSIQGKKVAIIGGGIGIAPLKMVAKALESDNSVDFFCGFRDETFATEEIRPYCDNMEIATESGRVGTKGYVTDIVDFKAYDVVMTCGPEVMMQVVAKKAKDAGTEVFVSRESKMACGIGACLGCTCKTKHGAKCICKDGPVFRGEDVYDVCEW